MKPNSELLIDDMALQIIEDPNTIHEMDMDQEMVETVVKEKNNNFGD